MLFHGNQISVGPAFWPPVLLLRICLRAVRERVAQDEKVNERSESEAKR
jgi:hypothetical protein